MQNASVRPFMVIAIAAVAASSAGCSTQTHRTSIPASLHGSTVPLPICGPEAPDATYSSTTNAPCTPTTTTSTSTTLPAPLPLGTAATLSYKFGNSEYPESAGIHIAVNRVWVGAAPELPTDGTEIQPQATLAGAVGQLLTEAHLPPTQKVTWIGVELSDTTYGNFPLGLLGGGGPGVPYLTIVVNGSLGGSLASELDVSFAEIGVAGCPFAWPRAFGSTPSSSSSGCFALAVPSGVSVSSVGFDLTLTTGGAEQHVAQWRL